MPLPFARKKDKRPVVETTVMLSPGALVARAVRFAQGTAERAQDRSLTRLDSAILLLERAAGCLDAALDAVMEAADLAEAVRGADSDARRALFAERFDEVLDGLDAIAARAGAEGANLLAGGATGLVIHLPPRNLRYEIRPGDIRRRPEGLDIAVPERGFTDPAEVEAAAAACAAGIERLLTLAARFGRDAALLRALRERSAGGLVPAIEASQTTSRDETARGEPA
jgi:hypothetical protein